MERSIDFGATSTTMPSAPTLRSSIVLEAGAASSTRAGETESATGGTQPPAAPAAEFGPITRTLAIVRTSLIITARPR
jgi:hypothetical protein